MVRLIGVHRMRPPTLQPASGAEKDLPNYPLYLFHDVLESHVDKNRKPNPQQILEAVEHTKLYYTLLVFVSQFPESSLSEVYVNSLSSRHELLYCISDHHYGVDWCMQ